MILGSHNSWSFLTPIKTLHKLIAFTARCQRVDIKTQYEKYGVRCFDLRIRFINNVPYVVHNFIVYCSLINIAPDLEYLNSKGNVSIRLIHDVRKKKDHSINAKIDFSHYGIILSNTYKNIKFWCGRNLYDWTEDICFPYNPDCVEKYSSVCKPKYIDDWYPLFYAKLNNKKILNQYYNTDILLIDFVDIK